MNPSVKIISESVSFILVFNHTVLWLFQELLIEIHAFLKEPYFLKINQYLPSK
jgi:hypothetical protein